MSRVLFLFFLGLFLTSCSKTVYFSVTPSDAEIYRKSGSKAGTGSCNVYFDAFDKKNI